MLYAIIEPKATIAKQLNPFNYDTILCGYMSASAQPYVLGAEETLFQVNFSIKNPPAPPDEPAVQEYTIIYTDLITLTAQQLSSWGTNDESALVAIADYYGITIVGYIE